MVNSSAVSTGGVATNTSTMGMAVQGVPGMAAIGKCTLCIGTVLEHSIHSNYFTETCQVYRNLYRCCCFISIVYKWISVAKTIIEAL